MLRCNKNYSLQQKQPLLRLGAMVLDGQLRLLGSKVLFPCSITLSAIILSPHPFLPIFSNPDRYKMGGYSK